MSLNNLSHNIINNLSDITFSGHVKMKQNTFYHLRYLKIDNGTL
jgi:competence protein ComGC